MGQTSFRANLGSFFRCEARLARVPALIAQAAGLACATCAGLRLACRLRPTSVGARRSMHIDVVTRSLFRRWRLRSREVWTESSLVAHQAEATEELRAFA